MAPVPRRGLVAAALVGVVVTMAFVVRAAAGPAVGPRPPFRLPVACGETWWLGTYRGHDDFDIDLMPASGQAWNRPILASYSGTVVTAGLQGSLGTSTSDHPKGAIGTGAGWHVKIDHGRGWETLYLHMVARPAVHVGQRVATGDLLGHVGSTGHSSAPHLHYEQRAGGAKVESFFGGVASGITHDDFTYRVGRVSDNCGQR